MFSNMLELKSVSISYGAVKAVHSASLGIDKGQLVALLGANGAGKTTIINSISAWCRSTQARSCFSSAHQRAVTRIGRFPWELSRF